MRAGLLDQQIIIETPTTTNDQGEVEHSWATLATVWARVITSRGEEAIQAARINARETIRVQMRYRSDVTTKQRLTWDSQVFYITAVDASMRRKGEMWLTAQLVGAV